MPEEQSEAEALARFEAWLLTIGDDDDAVDEESGLTGKHVHTILRLAKRGHRFVEIPRMK